MLIKAEVFASLKQIVGAPSVTLEVPEGCTDARLLETFAEAFPRVKEGINSVRVAVNDAYATTEQVIEEGDRVALIPPVSGGLYV